MRGSFGRLVRHQTAADFGEGFAGNDSFGSLPLVTSADTVEFQSRQKTCRLKRRETHGRVEGRDAQKRPILLDALPESRELLAFPRMHVEHVVVETGHVDAAVGVMK